MYKFYLPSGKEVDIDRLLAAMEDDSGAKWHLNIQTGQIQSNAKSGKNFDGRDWVPIKSITLPKIRRLMREYTTEFVEIEDLQLAKRLQAALSGQEAARRFEKILTCDKEGWEGGWAQFKADSLWEIAVDWLDGLPVGITQKLNLDDDCPICLAMKAAENQGRELTEEELRLAFKVANRKTPLRSSF